jgi:3-mercaptopyruvate sulfurtransferase SseA
MGRTRLIRKYVGNVERPDLDPGLESPDRNAMTRRLNTPQLVERLARQDVALLDVRPAAAFNGWKLDGEARGGHIRGARNFPLAWLNNVSRGEARAILASKGISAGRTVVVYASRFEASQAMADFLEELGYPQVAVYEPGWQEWAADPGLDVDYLKKYEKLVHPAWVKGMIRNPEERTSREGDPLIFEVGAGEADAYRKGHLPRAVYLDTSSFESPPTWNVLLAEELAQVLTAHGVRQESKVLLYGRRSDATARAALVMLYAGVGDVRLLDGGLQAWVSAGYELETQTRAPVAAEAFGSPIPTHPEYLIDQVTARALLADEDGVLACVRGWDEHVGETSGYDYIQLRGRIPGSTWAGLADTSRESERQFQNVDHTLRDCFETADLWRERGVTASKQVAFYCGTGWRASEAFLCAYLLGWKNISVYDGGWLEWSAQEDNPIEMGEPGSVDWRAARSDPGPRLDSRRGERNAPPEQDTR